MSTATASRAPMSPQELARVLRARREELRLTQRAVAERMGVGQSFLSDLETGHRRPGYAVAMRWCAAVEFAVLLSGGDE